ncbi:unnamed protein product [Acanthoscelides obtectus]|uniref:Uncharacterized protein n=1 Tax=Acanthoscelides obtectus TaxID=200917 RepID=A0A9P0Q5F6_ACAOB|nr:unnamed protein product [Acanthoscelides obtectus]CAK1637913.1 hypothetical protein AOBTE_LOCUS10286 [Acanthoscelides obtectus]
MIIINLSLVFLSSSFFDSSCRTISNSALSSSMVCSLSID